MSLFPSVAETNLGVLHNRLMMVGGNYSDNTGRFVGDTNVYRTDDGLNWSLISQNRYGNLAGGVVGVIGPDNASQKTLWVHLGTREHEDEPGGDGYKYTQASYINNANNGIITRVDTSGDYPAFQGGGASSNERHPAYDLEVRTFADSAVRENGNKAGTQRMYIAGGMGGVRDEIPHMRGIFYTDDGKEWHMGSHGWRGPLIHSQLLVMHRGGGSSDDELCLFGGVPVHTVITHVFFDFWAGWRNEWGIETTNHNNENAEGRIVCKRADLVDDEDNTTTWTHKGWLPTQAR